MFPIVVPSGISPPHGLLPRLLENPSLEWHQLSHRLVAVLASPMLWLPVAAVLLLATAVGLLRVLRQRELARGGRLIRLLAPPTVDPAGALTFWNNLIPLLRPAWKRSLFGQPHLTFEITADSSGLSFAIWVPDAVPPEMVEQAGAQRSDPDGGLEYTQRLLTIAAVGLLVATVLAVVCAPLLAGLYQGQHAGNAQLTTLTTQLGRLLLPQIFFYGIAALFGAILNTKERFAANAWAPVLNNVVVIAVAALLYADTHGRATLTHGLPARDLLILGIGTTLGIIVQAVVMVPSLLRSGFRFRWRWGWDPRLTEAGSLVGWAVGYVLLSQVGVVVTTRIANGAFADKSGTTIFSYASLLFQMPYGILGVAVLTAMMPRLARHAADGELAAVKDDVSLANRLSAVALLPVSAALLVLGGGLSVLLFEWGHVTRYVALQIGISIGALAIGLVPLAVTLVQMRVFYAMKDGRTPTAINAVMVAVRVPLLLGCAALAPRWVIPGLALATAVSYLVGAVVGEVWLRRRFGPMGSARTLRTIGQMALASAAGAAAAWAAVRYTVGLSPTTHLAAAVALAIGSAAGVLVIAAVAAALRVDELAPLWRRVARLARRGSPPSSVGVPDRQPEPPAMGESAGAAPTEQVRPSGSDPASSAGPAHQIGVVQFSNPTRGPSREQVDQRVRQPGADDPRDDTPPHDALVPPVDPQGAMGGSAEQGAPVQAGDSTVETAGSGRAADRPGQPGAGDGPRHSRTAAGRQRSIGRTGPPRDHRRGLPAGQPDRYGRQRQPVLARKGHRAAA